MRQVIQVHGFAFPALKGSATRPDTLLRREALRTITTRCDIALIFCAPPQPLSS
ncbi:hypothetical protein [Enterobacter sp. R4-368]|uniref:hypothetical protein n=1 Tax=Enterobacter sp. R4-368 TaxID=1166130 RepID=UPI00034EE0B9|nr:hypothetical protein [Enterobacter sp. R4-368]AGN85903.1 hypothetical protein H650_12355 [Enterobacter sp. R4-368]